MCLQERVTMLKHLPKKQEKKKFIQVPSHIIINIISSIIAASFFH